MVLGKSTLLYISPTIPAPSGNGRAMRAYNVLKRLSNSHNIHLLIISREVAKGKKYHIGKEVSALCGTIECVPIDPRRDLQLLFRVRLFKISRRLYYRFYASIENLYCSPKLIQTLKSLYKEKHFDIIHVFRIYMMGFAGCYISSKIAPSLQIDLDDIESRTHYRLSELYKLNRHKGLAKRMQLDAEYFQKLEKQVLNKADRIFVCSGIDKKWLSEKYQGAKINIIPNIVDIPNSVNRRQYNKCFKFLFIGSFGYLPNYDGILYFCRNILPLIRENTTKPFEVRIVGTGITKELTNTLSTTPNVKIVGAVPNVTPQYSMADAMIVPIRAGGGTRIKVLEAFAHRCPVVGTKLGVEGIDGRHEEHFLSSDSDDDFAQNCLKLMNDSHIAQRLTSNAFHLVKTMYVFEALKISLNG